MAPTNQHKLDHGLNSLNGLETQISDHFSANTAQVLPCTVLPQPVSNHAVVADDPCAFTPVIFKIHTTCSSSAVRVSCIEEESDHRVESIHAPTQGHKGNGACGKGRAAVVSNAWDAVSHYQSVSQRAILYCLLVRFVYSGSWTVLHGCSTVD